MKFLRKFRSAEEYAEYIRTADSSNMHLMPTISLLAFGDEEKPKVGYVNADLTFKFTTEMEYEERWFSSRGGGGGGESYSISTFEGVSGQTSGGFVKQAYLDGKLYYVNNGNIYDGGGSSPHSLRYNASTSSQSSWWDGIVVKEPGQHILQLVLDKTGVEDEFIVGNTGFMNIDELYIDDTITGLGEYFIDGGVGTLYVPETVSYISGTALGNDALSIQIHENNPYIESINNGNGLVDKINGVLIYANKNVTEFTIPEGIKGIAGYVFYYASDLVSITFPSTLEWIGEGAFTYCSGLTGELVIPDSVTSIGNYAFQDCSGLTSLEIGSGCTSIGDYAFYRCSGLTGELVIPDSVTSIGERTFYNCSGLTSVEIGSGVTSIGSSAFADCSGLTGELVIPDSVTSIGYSAFYQCSGLTSVEIGSGCTSIGESTFHGCTGLTSVVIPDSVISISSSAFTSCYGLTSVEIGSGCTSIGKYAFQYCSGLTSVEIGSGCTSIGKWAFADCSKLTEVTCHAVTAPSITNDTFQNVKTYGKLSVPAGSDYSSWMSTSSYYLGYSNWFAYEIGVELPQFELDGYDVAMLVQPTTTGSTKICNKTTDIAEIKVNDTILSSISTGYTFGEAGKWNVVRIKYTDGVASIPSSGFSGCTRMYDVKIADSVTSINGYAFRYCYGLASIEIGSGVTSIGSYAFNGCSGLTGELVIPDSVTTIGSYAFDGCSGLTSVEIGSGCTSIGQYAFRGCLGLESIVISSGNTIYDSRENCNCVIETSTNTLIQGSNNSFIPDSVTSIGESAFNGCTGLTGELVIPDSVTSIGNYAFNYCSGLTSVLNIPNSVTSIGESAFNGCTGLTGELVIPDSVTSIGNYAFQDCSGLTRLEIGSGVTSIGNGVFLRCTGLTSVVIPDSVTSISQSAFSDCSKLTSVVIPDSVTSIGNYAFNYCSGLTSVEIGSGCTSIGNYAFNYCSGLTSVEIGSGVTSIGNYAFAYCSGLTSVEIGGGCTSIGDNAFAYCSDLTSVEIGSGVTSIGQNAFLYCSGLTEIICHAVTAPSIKSNTFQKVKSNGTLYVSFGSDYSSWMNTNYYYLGYYNWTQQVTYSPTECTSLSITADDVDGRATKTTIYWTAVTNGVDFDGNPINNMTITGETISSEFPQNTSETETVERTITFEYMGVTASTTITQGVWVNAGYTVDLNSQWQLSTSITNPDSSTYEGVYESFSNKGVNSSAAIMYIDIVGYETFQLYIRSNGESCCDYVVVSNLDCALSNGTTSGTNVKMTTQSNSQSGTAISNYKLVEFTGIDGGEHRITVMYRKDGSVNNGTDQGYVLIPKNQ